MLIKIQGVIFLIRKRLHSFVKKHEVSLDLCSDFQTGMCR